jgi:hypothetical protein
MLVKPCVTTDEGLSCSVKIEKLAQDICQELESLLSMDTNGMIMMTTDAIKSAPHLEILIEAISLHDTTAFIRTNEASQVGNVSVLLSQFLLNQMLSMICENLKASLIMILLTVGPQSSI